MAKVINYVCDISGKTSTDPTDFIQVKVEAVTHKPDGTLNPNYLWPTVTIIKLVHKDIATKLNLVRVPKDAVAEPEVTFESKLALLLKDYIESVVTDAVADEMSNR
jgi:hypothetical protein